MLRFTKIKKATVSVLFLLGMTFCTEKQVGKDQPPDTDPLVHAVFFQLKKDLSAESIDSFLIELKKLGELESVNGIEIGRLAQTGDPRLMEEYRYVMYLLFNSIEDLDRYQKDTIHLKIKKESVHWMAGPPLVHDSFVK